MAGEASTTDVIDLPFDVPEDWGTPRLSTSCEFVRDGDWIESKDQGGDDYRLLQISNIGTGRFIETGNYRWITQETFQRLNCTEILPGDVLVARMPEPTGRAWCVPEPPWRAVTAVDVAIIRTRNTELDPRFLAYFLNSPACLGIVQSLTTGTTRLRIRRADIARLQIPLPSVDEQRAIAHILGTLDDKIELNRRMNETLEAIARALFKSWFVDFDPVRAKTEGRDPGLPAHLADLFPDSFEDSELGEIPRGWRVGSVDDAFDLTMGQSPPGDTYNEIGSGPPFFQGRADFGFRFPTRRVYCTAPTRFANAGDTLVSVRAPVGDINMAVERCAIGRGVAAIRHKTGGRSFTFYSMRSFEEAFAGFEADGTVFGSISKKDFHNLATVVPNPAVVRALEKIVGPFDDKIEGCEHESRTLVALRDSLLPKLISGELRVPDTEGILEAAV